MTYPGASTAPFSPTASACWTMPLLEPLAVACAEEGRYEFMLTINPLRVMGGTGSPVNPVALL